MGWCSVLRIRTRKEGKRQLSTYASLDSDRCNLHSHQLESVSRRWKRPVVRWNDGGNGTHTSVIWRAHGRLLNATWRIAKRKTYRFRPGYKINPDLWYASKFVKDSREHLRNKSWHYKSPARPWSLTLHRASTGLRQYTTSSVFFIYNTYEYTGCKWHSSLHVATRANFHIRTLDIGNVIMWICRVKCLESSEQ